MIHLRRGVLSRLLRPPSPHLAAAQANPILSLHRLLSTAAPIPPKPFVVEDYLVTSCGLTRARAAKASKRLSHLKSPSNPDAVLAFLSELGLSKADIATAVTNDPRLICARVTETLAARVTELIGLGLTRPQIARLIPLVRGYFRCRCLAHKLAFLRTVYGSFDKCLEVLKVNHGFVSSNLEKVIKPNVAFLQQCGINLSNQPSYTFLSRIVCRPNKHLGEAVVRANELGLEQGSRMFGYAVKVFALLSQEKLAKNLGLFEKLGWSHDDVSLAVKKLPHILTLREEKVRRNISFLTKDVGLEIPYIARRPALIMYSTECRLLPRHCLINVLKANGLLETDPDFNSIAVANNVKFMDKFVHPYAEHVPGLVDAYVSSCTGCGVHQLKVLSKMRKMC